MNLPSRRSAPRRRTLGAGLRVAGIVACQLAWSAHAAETADKAPPAGKAAKPADAKSAGGKAAALGGTGSSDLPVMTRNELRTCLSQQDKLNAMQADVMKEQAELEAEKGAIEQQRVALKSELDTLDRTSATAVDAYNAKSVEQDQRIDAYNQRGGPFNAKASQWKEQHAAWDKECANRRYQENDLIAIKAGR